MNAQTGARQRIGNYELLAELASGGMATVSIARQVGAGGFERLVVVKRVHKHLLANADFSNMLRDEARVTSSIRHPNVVSAVDVVRDESELLLVMEYVDSIPLSDLGADAVSTTPLPVGVIGRILADVLAGLEAAHSACDIRGKKLGVVHRDMSPHNVIVGVDGVSRVIDFGIAKAASRLTTTRSGLVKGKVSYMAPEQLEGEAVDRRADLFAVGIILFELLSNRRLFSGKSEAEIMRRVLTGTLPNLAELAPNLPPALVVSVNRALERKADGRFQTADHFLAALEQTMPIAPAREVAACLEQRLGKEIEARRSQLRAVLSDTELDRLSPRVETGFGSPRSELTKTRPRVEALSDVPPTVRFRPILNDTIADDMLHVAVPALPATLASVEVVKALQIPATRQVPRIPELATVSEQHPTPATDPIVIPTTPRKWLVVGAIAAASLAAGGFGAWARSTTTADPGVGAPAVSAPTAGVAQPLPVTPPIAASVKSPALAVSESLDAAVALPLARPPASAPASAHRPITPPPPRPASARDDLHKSPYD